MEKKLRKLLNRRMFMYPKTEKILEVREELYTIMLDKYDDCLAAGMSKEESFKSAAEMMSDYKAAIREVETGSSLSALRKNLIGTAYFSSFYFIAVTFIYLFASLVMLKTFKSTWLIVVGGAFFYFLYFSVLTYRYARLFNFRTLGRCGIGLIYISLIPIFYVFPALYTSEVYGQNIWFAWPIVVVFGFFYILSDYLSYRKEISTLEKELHLLVAGLLLTTFLYLAISIWFNLWGTAWIIYVLFLAIVSLACYIDEKRKKL